MTSACRGFHRCCLLEYLFRARGPAPRLLAPLEVQVMRMLWLFVRCRTRKPPWGCPQWPRTKPADRLHRSALWRAIAPRAPPPLSQVTVARARLQGPRTGIGYRGCLAASRHMVARDGRAALPPAHRRRAARCQPRGRTACWPQRPRRPRRARPCRQHPRRCSPLPAPWRRRGPSCRRRLGRQVAPPSQVRPRRPKGRWPVLAGRARGRAPGARFVEARSTSSTASTS